MVSEGMVLWYRGGVPYGPHRPDSPQVGSPKANGKTRRLMMGWPRQPCSYLEEEGEK